jgi:kinetochore protein NDC80
LLEDLKVEIEKLSATIRDQNLSQEEVIKMNTDRETLQRNLEDLRQKIDESKKVVLNLEVTVANRITTVEEALDLYTGMLTTLGLYPTPPEPWQDVDLSLELNSGSANPQQLLSGSDIRKLIRPTLSSVAEHKRQERAVVDNESVKVNNELDQLTTECINLGFEISEIEEKVTQLNEQADDLRDVCFLLVFEQVYLKLFLLGFTAGGADGEC